jgi:hypothetical protein
VLAGDQQAEQKDYSRVSLQHALLKIVPARLGIRPAKSASRHFIASWS